MDGPPNLDTVTLNIQRESSRIHAAYLFEHIGKATLQKLCLLLSSTATGKIYNGWQEFAAHMGLTMEQIRVRYPKGIPLLRRRACTNAHAESYRFLFYSKRNININCDVNLMTTILLCLVYRL